MSNSFTFCILAYNHKDYIIEHLESVKYLVSNFGYKRIINLIVNDDASSDGTSEYIDMWLLENGCIFDNVKKIYNVNNLGTCESLVNICNYLDTDICKITAGDDVYSCENIFEFIDSYDYNSNIVSGMPIRLYDMCVKDSFLEKFNYFASDIVYKNNNLITRLSSPSIINAPNLFYPVKFLKNKNVIEIVSNYDVVEDLPLQIAIAKNYSDASIISTSTPIVLYRRTIGSTYIVANKRFVKDQLLIFDYLINIFETKNKIFNVLLLKNRKLVFRLRRFNISKFLNFPLLIYIFRAFYSFFFVVSKYNKASSDLIIYQKHYDYIKKQSDIFLGKIK